jgi:hypothetical protein
VKIPILLALAPALFAQAHRSIILGSVADRSGAVIPGASVKVVKIDTNVAYPTSANELGIFEVPGLLPGSYRVEASARGFKTASVDGIALSGGKRAEIDLKLDVGDVAESVTVQSERALLDTASADVNTVLDERKLRDLPIGQGNVTYLFLLAPGADSASAVARGTSVGNDVMPMQRAGTSQSRFNGSPMATAEFTIDGAPNTQRGNALAGGGAAFNPGPDMVQEVRVQTTTFDASVGHSGGATIDVVLKSGTNRLHGTFNKFFRDKEWNANTWAGNRGGTPRTDFQYKLHGFTVGGPVWLGPLYKGKDRTFFFVGWEDWASLSPNPPAFVNIPTQAQVRGDFSALGRLGPTYQIYDPRTGALQANGRIQRQPFAGNTIPASRIHPVSAAFAKLWPEPNTTGSADGQRNFTYLNEPFPRTLFSLPMRFDHALSQSQKLFARLVMGNTKLPRSGVFTREDISVWKINSDNRELALGDVWTIGSNFITDLRGSIMRFTWDTVPLGTELDYKQFGLESLAPLFDTRLAGPPNLTVTGYEAFPNQQGTQQVSEIRSGSVNLTRISGAHSLKFGGDGRWYIDNRGRNDRVTIPFNGTYTRGPLDSSAAAPIGQGLADFLLGHWGQATLNQPSKAANLSTYQGFYFQDDWRASSRLTLNLGVRYEREGPATERFNRNLAGFDTVVENPIAAQARAAYARSTIPGLPADQFQVRGGLLFAGAGGNPRTIFDTNTRNFAPRIGAAYRLRPTTVLRAGFGIYFIPYGQRFIANEGGVPGFDTNTFSFASQDGLAFTRALDNMFPDGLTPAVGSSLGLRTFLGQGFTVPAPRRNPHAYNQRWQFSVQRRIAGAYKVEARYVGNHTVKMPLGRNANALENRYLSTSPERDQARIDYLSGRADNPFFGIAGVGGNLGTARVVNYSDLLLPYPSFAAINAQYPQGATWYHAFQTELERQLDKGLTFQVGYTWAKTIDALSYLNPADPGPERVISDFHRPHILRVVALWEIPFARRKLWGGWQVQALSWVQSGYPIPFGNVLFRGDIKAIGNGGSNSDLIFNVDAGFERNAARQLANNVRTFSTRFASATTGTQANTDFSIHKTTRFAERVEAQFRAEAYNVFNQHFIQGAIDTNPVNRTFGSSVAASGPRTLQLGFRVAF